MTPGAPAAPPRRRQLSAVVLATLLCACQGDESPCEDDGSCADAGDAGDAGARDAADDATPPPADAGPLDGAPPDALDAASPDAGGPGELPGAPLLSNFAVTDADRDRVYFDSSESIRASTITGFTVSDKTVVSVTINGERTTGHHFTVDAPFDHFSNNTIRYEDGSDIQDIGGAPCHPFTLRYVDNRIPEPPATGNTYYVTTSGRSVNDGLTEGSAWDIEHAFASARAGDRVWIKAGDYGDVTCSVAADGTPEAPIKFIGYRLEPGDIDSMYYTPGDGALDPSQMPLLDHGDGGTGRATEIRGDYIIIRNLQATNAANLFYATNAPVGVVFDNVLAHTSGRTVDQPGEQGKGIHFNSDATERSRITNSTAINCSVANVRMYGSNNLIDNVWSYSDRDDMGRGEATDYFVVVRGDNIIIRNSRITRVGDLAHNGHGFSFKASGISTEHCLLESSLVENVKGAIEARHRPVQHNVFRDVTITANPAVPSDNGAIVINDGASFNVFENILIYDTNEAFRWYESSEDGGSQPAGHDNLFRNIVVRNVGSLFYSGRFDVPVTGVISDNSWSNCTFSDVGVMFGALRQDFDDTNTFTNCIFDDVRRRVHGSSMFDPAVVETYSDYSDCAFPTPGGAGNVELTPGFVGATDLRLEADSPVRDLGTDLSEVRYDYGGVERMPGLYSMGAYEVD